MMCPDDSALAAFVAGDDTSAERARVESHLDECAECLAIVCEAARTAPDASDHTDRSEGASELVEPARDLGPEPRRRGATVGRYTLLTMLGQGAMGSVYSAHDARLDRKVALKLLRADRPDATRERLSREARAMARVTHPSVVRVYDAGEIDEGVFLAMELVEGTTLGVWLEAARPQREILEAFLAAGRGLAAAHAANIVHRDFKPENVLVDRSGRVAVSDFGLAELTGGDGDITRKGTRLGTPLYMSREQHRGEPVDARTDQFSFAVALYAALYGEHPFVEDGHLEELRDCVDRGAIRPLSSSAARRSVPAALRRVLLRALAASSRDRYPTMESLIRDLETASRGHRSRAAIAIVAAAMAAIAIALVAFARVRAERASALAQSVVASASAAPSAEVRAVVTSAPEPTVSSPPLVVRAAPPAPRAAGARVARSAASTPPVSDAATSLGDFPSSRK